MLWFYSRFVLDFWLLTATHWRNCFINMVNNILHMNTNTIIMIWHRSWFVCMGTWTYLWETMASLWQKGNPTFLINAHFAYSSQVMNGSHEHPYTNPKAPVHVITGSAVSIYLSMEFIYLSTLLGVSWETRQIPKESTRMDSSH